MLKKINLTLLTNTIKCHMLTVSSRVETFRCTPVMQPHGTCSSSYNSFSMGLDYFYILQKKIKQPANR